MPAVFGVDRVMGVVGNEAVDLWVEGCEERADGAWAVLLLDQFDRWWVVANGDDSLHRYDDLKGEPLPFASGTCDYWSQVEALARHSALDEIAADLKAARALPPFVTGTLWPTLVEDSVDNV